MGNEATVYPIVRKIDLELVAKGLDRQAMAGETFKALMHLMSYSGIDTQESQTRDRQECIQQLSDRLITASHIPVFTTDRDENEGKTTLMVPPVHIVALADRALQTQHPRYAMFVYALACHHLFIHPDDHAMELAAHGLQKAAQALDASGCAEWSKMGYKALERIMQDPRQQITFDNGFTARVAQALFHLEGVSHPSGYWKNLRHLMDEMRPDNDDSLASPEETPGIE